MERLRAWDDMRVPSPAAIRGHGVGAVATARPHDLVVHWPDGNQTIGRAAILQPQRRLADLSIRSGLLRAADCAGEHGNDESNK